MEKLFHKMGISPSILAPYKKYILFLFFIMLFAAMFEAVGLGLIIPFLGIVLGDISIAETSKVISYFNDIFSRVFPDDKKLIGICLIIVIVFLLKNLFIYLKSVLTLHFYNSLRQYWSSEIMKKYIHADYDYIISQKRGTLINNLVNEPMLASKFVGQLTEFISRAIIVASIYILMLTVNWEATLILSIIAALVLGTVWKASTKFSISIGEKRLKLNQEITAQGEQSLNGVRQIKLFSLENNVCKSFSGKYANLKKILVRLGVFRYLPVPLSETLLILCLVLVLIYYDYASSTPIAAILPLLAFFMTTAQKLYQNIATLVSGRMWLLSYIPSLKLVNSILSAEEISRENLSEGIVMDKMPGDIEFKDVSFLHNGASRLFSNLNLHIPKNKITAIVGKSGSGKSTLVDLLCGLYKGYNGKILIKDIELKEINLSSWRKMIGFVSQDTFLFNTSVKENVLLGNDKATENDIVISCKTANAHDFIENLPDGYDTVLGDRGLKLSGGQRQRVTVARALVRSPELLIFDEATSSLDTESERLIQESIESLRQNKTIIIIAHRLSTIKNADLIYVLDNGNIIESGSYNELIEKQGFFHSMLLQQS